MNAAKQSGSKKTNSPATATREITPDQMKLTKIQAKRLGQLTNIKIEEAEGLTVAQLSERLKWVVDPALFLFRRICGRVVKKDPVTGIEYPVPFATVIVEDTDCNLISYFPLPWPWGWFFPFNCHRETIATTKTDACGNFCVWVPRFDIDWILEWRRRRICFPIFFKRPWLRDLIPIEKLRPPVVGPWPPIPDPDPGPLRNAAVLPQAVLEAVGGKMSGALAEKLARGQINETFGAESGLSEDALNVRAFDTELPPPLPKEFTQVLSGKDRVQASKGASEVEGVRSAVALKLGLEPSAKEIVNFDPQRFIGPFFRCYDIFLPEWHLILDVPDITFRVTQDTNGDGTEETIYSEGYFDVRWDAGAIPPVKLVASSIAKESHACDTPPVICGNVPAILFAGLMPLTNGAYFNSGTGYALRPNRPSQAINNPPCPGSANAPRTTAQTPFCQTLQIYGCANVKNAQFYRVLESIDGGATFSAMTGHAWNIYTIPGGLPVPIAADAAGWYAVITNPAAFHPANMLIEFATPALQQLVLKLEIGNGAKAVIGSSGNVAIRVDNTAPTVLFSRLAWKFTTEGDGAFRSLLGIPCPTIRRGATPQDVEVTFEVTISANHFRDACIGSSGCGSGEFILQSGVTSHWHENSADNSVFLHGRYRLDHTALEGSYTFAATARSRAMNPAGSDNGHLADWFYDNVFIYTHTPLGVAVING